MAIPKEPFLYYSILYIYAAMSKDFYTLPDEFGVSCGDTLIYFYSNNNPSAKMKVLFTKNILCLLQHGRKEVQTATDTGRITNEELLMLTSGSVIMSDSVAEPDKYEAILIFFGNQTLSDFCAKRNFTAAKKLQSTSILKLYRDDFLNNFCHSLKLLRNENNKEIDELKVVEILGYISSKYPETFEQLVSQALADPTNIKLKQIIELNINKGLTINELSFLCNMSISTFKRHFASLYNMSPQKYFTQIKMEQAKGLLLLHKRPSEIYHQLGYENLSAFSNEFKKFYGVSPKQYQDKNERLEKEFDPLE